MGISLESKLQAQKPRLVKTMRMMSLLSSKAPSIMLVQPKKSLKKSPKRNPKRNLKKSQSKLLHSKRVERSKRRKNELHEIDRDSCGLVIGRSPHYPLDTCPHSAGSRILLSILSVN